MVMKMAMLIRPLKTVMATVMLMLEVKETAILMETKIKVLLMEILTAIKIKIPSKMEISTEIPI